MRSLKLIFFGTPDFAVPSLDILFRSSHHVKAVVTAPDKPAGRNLQLQQSAVKQYALLHGIDVLQPLKLKDEKFINQLRSLEADLFVVVAFRMLPEVVWSMPPLGSINLHASLLPQYRGAAPINWAIINGEKETGVTTFFLQHEIDTGNIIFQETVSINDEDNAGTLHDKLMLIGASLLKKTVDAIASGDYPQIPQAHIDNLKKAPKIFREHCLIDFAKPVVQVHNLIRGLSPVPGAYFVYQGKQIKVFKASHEICIQQHQPGTIHTDGKNYLKISCADGFINLEEVQLEGKKRLDIKSFLRGFAVLQE
ncbi:MAG: methionyl-tRNA formyltransferase [Chitinophagales bacterium]|nr:methionyl-tRNA formyltransferase [Chitinophagales bacterium]MDW8273822.1 methionyl-tRNA formyltransferase [Chitinophagales bacterium]